MAMEGTPVGSNGVARRERSAGVGVPRFFTAAGTDPLDDVRWVRTTATIRGEDGGTLFEMRDVEAPAAWSPRAVDIVVNKYFRKAGLYGDASKGETSVRQIVERVADTIADDGHARGYFASAADARAFRDELAWLLVHQHGAFNSPVWFNVGLWHKYGIEGADSNWAWDDAQGAVAPVEHVYRRPPASACFILQVDDSIESIFETVKTEVRLFKHGSGAGANFSRLRGRQEKLSGGGTSSGLMSFLGVGDRAAGSLKSGGGTRRAAKLVALDMDHPEILDFITFKVREEKKARALIAAGFSRGMEGEAYTTVSGQNANNSVRVTDAFMRAVETDGEWCTTARTTGEVVSRHRARDLWRAVAQAAWECADPGVQYDTTINAWHTVPNSGRINGANPCCISGEMLVATTAGLVPIAALAAAFERGEALPDARVPQLSGGPETRRILRAWKSGETRDLVEVRTRGGHVIRCTPEHRFLLQAGSYVEAQTLTDEWLQLLRHERGDGCVAAGVERIRLASPVAVYDLEVEGVHHFAVTNPGVTASPVVVHNSEYMHLDNSACNLASLNLAKFAYGGAFKTAAFRAAVRTFILAQEILVDLASYPTAAIARNSHDFRPLGLGYTNLGAMLMRAGIAYDSDKGRLTAASVTALLQCYGGLASAEVAAVKGPFAGYAINREPMLDVMQRHADAAYALPPSPLTDDVRAAADAMMQEGRRHGFRNAQLSVLAPAGTISFLMDADTTGIEPDLALTKRKKMAGGGVMMIPNESLGAALEALGYDAAQRAKIQAHVTATGAVEGAPGVHAEHLPVFDCALPTGPSRRSISADGHLKMMAAVQPFISGAISKTTNISADATVDDVERIYMQGWKLGLKAVAIYRDGCKGDQPLSSTGTAAQAPAIATPVAPAPARLSPAPTARQRLPKRRGGFTQEARVGGHKLFLRTGEYPDGSLGEIFIDMHKEGAAFRAMTHSFAQLVSLALQHGVPLDKMVSMFTHTRFEPAGPVADDARIKMTTSVLDYIFRVLAIDYLGRDDLANLPTTPPVPHVADTLLAGEAGSDVVVESRDSLASPEPSPAHASTGDPCGACGGTLRRAGACKVCETCGSTTGCG